MCVFFFFFFHSIDEKIKYHDFFLLVYRIPALVCRLKCKIKTILSTFVLHFISFFFFLLRKYQLQILGQHLKKSSLSESSSDMMDLEEGVESTPGILGDSQIRLPPFLGSVVDKQQINCCKSPSNGQNLQQRHNSALAVSIETDV